MDYSIPVIFILNRCCRKGKLTHCSIINFFNIVYKIQIISSTTQAPLTSLAWGTCKCSLRWGSSQQMPLLYWLSHTWKNKERTHEYHMQQILHISSDRQIYLRTGRLTSSVNLTSTPFSVTVIQFCSVTIFNGNNHGIILTRDTAHKPLQYFIKHAVLGTVCYKSTFVAHIYKLSV
jgi:hypothetical protein